MVLDEIASYLQAAGVGTVGTDIFVGRMPDTPGACLGLHEYAGAAPSFAHDGEQPLFESPRVQVRVRGATYTTGRQMIEAAYNALNRVKNQNVGGVRYMRIAPLQQPFYLQRDGNERPEFVFNVEAKKALSSSMQEA